MALDIILYMLEVPIIIGTFSGRFDSNIYLHIMFKRIGHELIELVIRI